MVSIFTGKFMATGTLGPTRLYMRGSTAYNSLNTHMHTNYFSFLDSSIGLLKFTPLNCNSMSDGVCVKHVKRGQPVTLCTSHTTTPSTIPQGKNVLSVMVYYWLSDTEGHRHDLYLCYSTGGSCKRAPSNARDFLYSDVSNSCLTIKNVQNDKKYILEIYYNGTDAETNVTFSVTCGGMCELVYVNLSMA